MSVRGPAPHPYSAIGKLVNTRLLKLNGIVVGRLYGIARDIPASAVVVRIKHFEHSGTRPVTRLAVICRGEKNSAVLESYESVVIDDIVAVDCRTTERLAKGLALVGRAHEIGHTKQVLALHRFAQIRDSEVAVLHTEQADRHNVESLVVLGYKHAAPYPALSLVRGIISGNSRGRVVVTLCSVIVRIRVHYATVLESYKRALAVTGIFLPRRQKEHFFSYLFHFVSPFYVVQT